jgi:hypothetical protein
LWRFAERLVYLCSGEFLFRGEANGGTVIFLRSAITGLVLFAIAIATAGISQTGLHLGINWQIVRNLVATNLAWAGAMFAGAYAAFYSRFSSQWNYLAGVYNQLMAAQVQAPIDATAPRRRAYAAWKAGIVEDAYTLHLATKRMFAPLIVDLLEEKDVYEAFKETTVISDDQLQSLLIRLEKVTNRRIELGSTELDEAGRLVKTPTANPNPLLTHSAPGATTQATTTRRS